MGWSKQQLIEAAFEEIGLASYIFDIEPDELQSVGRKLEAMIATWNALGVRLGYNASSSADIDLDADSGLPDSANEATYLHLAMRIAGGYGKTISEDQKGHASVAYAAMTARTVRPIPVQQPVNMVSGAGNRRWDRRNFVLPPTTPIETGLDGQIDQLDVE